MPSALVVEGLRKAYGRVPVVDGVDLEVAEGETFGIDPQEQPDKAAALVGIQLQESALPDRIKVWEALRLFGALGRRNRTMISTSPERVTDGREVLEQWGLTDKRNASFASLSGGLRQRLLVALALVARPRLVFLDEMTTGLDPAARRDAWRVGASLTAAGLGDTIIAVQDPWLGRGTNWAELAIVTGILVVASVLAVPALRKRA